MGNSTRWNRVDLYNEHHTFWYFENSRKWEVSSKKKLPWFGNKLFANKNIQRHGCSLFYRTLHILFLGICEECLCKEEKIVTSLLIINNNKWNFRVYLKNIGQNIHQWLHKKKSVCQRRIRRQFFSW